jgi:hypothetical protein
MIIINSEIPLLKKKKLLYLFIQNGNKYIRYNKIVLIACMQQKLTSFKSITILHK